MRFKRTEYIDKQTAKGLICELCNMAYGDEPCEPCDCEWLQMLAEEPCADVAPVKKGQHEVLPCPFCGGKARFEYKKPLGLVVCRECGACGRVHSDSYEEADCKAEAVEAWNRRVTDGA